MAQLKLTDVPDRIRSITAALYQELIDAEAVAAETGARVAFVGDRHQLPAVGRGGVLDHGVSWAHPTAVVTLGKVHRFTDPDYAALSLRMRNGDDPDNVFDALHRRGQIVIHASEVERPPTSVTCGHSRTRRSPTVSHEPHAPTAAETGPPHAEPSR